MHFFNFFRFLTTTIWEDALALVENLFDLALGLLDKLSAAIQENVFVLMLFATVVVTLATWVVGQVIRIVNKIRAASGK